MSLFLWEKFKCLALQLILEGNTHPTPPNWNENFELQKLLSGRGFWVSYATHGFPTDHLHLRDDRLVHYSLLNRKEGSTIVNNRVVFSARFPEKGNTFWVETNFRLNKVSVIWSPPLLYYYFHCNATLLLNISICMSKNFHL